MTSRFSIVAATLICLAVLAQPAHSSVLFENSVLFDFQASGPAGLSAGQNASVCATNLDSSPVSVLIALLQADNGSLLASQTVTLQAGAGKCLNYSFPPSPNGPAPARNVIGLVAPSAHLTEPGAIIQDRPGGGCISASLQIQAATLNNVAGQTFLYVPMQDHHESGAHTTGQNRN